MDNLATNLKWIPVVYCDGTNDTLTLRDALVNAHNIFSIYGDYPIQTAALWRFVTAAAIATHRQWDTDTLTEIRTNGRFDADAIATYFDQWHHRFNLNDPTAPIYQTTGLYNEYGHMVEIDNTRSAGNNVLWWDHVPRDTPYSPERAARCLLVGQTAHFSGNRGAPRDIEQRRPDGVPGAMPLQSGTLASRAIYLIPRDNLVNTIIDNTPPGYTGPRDTPIWERDPDHFDADTWDEVTRIPLGIMDWYTWPSRMVHLRRNADGLYDGAILTAGEKLDEHYRMGPYRVPDPIMWWTNRSRSITLADATLSAGIYEVGTTTTYDLATTHHPVLVTGKRGKQDMAVRLGDMVAISNYEGLAQRITYDPTKKKAVIDVSSWSTRPTPAAVRLDPDSDALPSVTIMAEMQRLDWTDPDAVIRARRYGQHADNGKILGHSMMTIEIRLANADGDRPTPGDVARRNPNDWVREYVGQFGPMRYDGNAAPLAKLSDRTYQWVVTKS